MPSGKGEAAGFHHLGDLAAAQPEEIRTRRTAAEQTLSTVRARLGAPGTFDLPGLPTSSTTTGFDFGKGFVDHELEAGKRGDRRYVDPKKFPRATILDPQKYTAELEKSSEFRLASRLTAEAEQLVAREGPLYDEMINNIQLPIIEGATAMARENTEQLRKSMQRGGSARRSAFKAVQEMRARERINSDKVQQLSSSRFALDKWARDNARTQLEFNQNWAANLGGVREEYQRGMDMAADLMVSKSLPFMFMAKQEAAKWRYYAHAKTRNKLGRWITGALGVLAMVGGAAMQSPQLVGAGAQMTASSVTGIPSPAERSYGAPSAGSGQVNPYANLATLGIEAYQNRGS